MGKSGRKASDGRTRVPAVEMVRSPQIWDLGLERMNMRHGRGQSTLPRASGGGIDLEAKPKVLQDT